MVASHEEPTPRPTHLLLLSASPLCCFVLRLLLQPSWTVAVFLRPLPALQCLWRHTGTPPLALLLDLSSPWDGYTVAYQIRTTAPSLLRALPILGLSDRASLLDRLRAHVVGIDAILLKPFAPHALLDLLTTWETNPPRKH